MALVFFRKKFGKSDPFGKEKLEDADFDNMKWKLRTVDVSFNLILFSNSY